jgi:hypothetical protein
VAAFEYSPEAITKDAICYAGEHVRCGTANFFKQPLSPRMNGNAKLFYPDFHSGRPFLHGIISSAHRAISGDSCIIIVPTIHLQYDVRGCGREELKAMLPQLRRHRRHHLTLDCGIKTDTQFLQGRPAWPVTMKHSVLVLLRATENR